MTGGSGIRLLDVLGDLVLERSQLFVQLLGRDLLVRLRLADQPGRSLDGRAPGRLVRVGVALDGRVGQRLDLVEIDVRVSPALVLVVLDARSPALRPLGGLADRLAERRVLLAVGVADYEAGVLTSAICTSASMWC
jgi:hypothetical protein